MLNDELNELLVETFNIILKVEEKSLKKSGGDLSMSEFHLLETVAKNNPAQNTVSSVAAALRIKLPSATIALKKLEQKGYVKRTKSEEDARIVYIELTEKGRKLNMLHQKFHEHMVNQITAHMKENEKELLYKVVLKLNEFFKRILID